MGIGRGTIKQLMQEGLQRPFKGRVLTLGKQDVAVNRKELESIAKEMRFPLQDTEIFVSDDEFISDVYLLTRLGFSDCKSMDYSDYEGCDYVFDLNRTQLPPSLIDGFDVIIDGGTTEHVFHIPNVLSNLFKMARIGARILHFSPSSNHIDHGFYMFSPTLFWDYYQANKFKINQFQIIRHNPWHDTPWTVWNYTPGCLNGISYGGLDSGMYAIHCVVTKTPESTAGVVPQQRNYQEGLWKEQKRDNPKKTLWSMAKKGIKKSPFLYRLLRPLAWAKRPKKGIKLKVVARF
jgi:hypothetical protein